MKYLKILLIIFVLNGFHSAHAFPITNAAADSSQNSADQSQNPKIYRKDSKGNCYYINNKKRRKLVMKKYCSANIGNREKLADIAPAHKILPGTRENESEYPADQSEQNPVEQSPVVPRRKRSKPKPVKTPNNR